MAGPRAPTGTYRLQLSAAFTFADAAAGAGYLEDLGVSHAYLSPILQAAPGSTHGYDTVDHDRISADLGGADGLRALLGRLREHGLGGVADIVPNHMAVPVPEYLNRPLWSVLRDGPSSPCARWFDIDWEAQDQAMLMPVLGRRIGECLAAGEITLDRLDGAAVGGTGPQPVVRYYDHVLPVRPGTEDLPLAELLGAQWYRLAYWRVADEELNYRRFFDVDTLAAIRMEDPDVFAATHRLICSLVRDGSLDGLRVDHPDGLADPRGYLRRLADATGGSWVVVEKILASGEELPADWPCAGTTGYDAANLICGVFVDPAGEAPLTELYTAFTGSPPGFGVVAEAAKRQVLTEVLRAEVRRLTDLLAEIQRGDVWLADHLSGDLTAAVTELLVAFPVYRGYAVPGEPPPEPTVGTVDAAAAVARTRLSAEQHPTLDLVRDLALGRYGTDGARGEFLVRFQQTSAPAMAKGVEDTAFYRWSRLLCRNDVGSDPADFAVEPDRFHKVCARQQRYWPQTLTALTTHDSKRAEDVRARLAVLSELPVEWEHAVTAWSAAARSGPGDGHEDGAKGQPDAETEYLIWQTLVGAWPIEPDRLITYLRKAIREAKRHTAWTAPDEGYESAVFAFAERALAAAERPDGVAALVDRIASHARVNSLGQKLLQLVMPGVPDVYQGTELVSLALVDPDNRRPVDYDRRRELLARLDAGATPAALDSPLDAEKLLVTSRALRLRRERPELFGPDAGYQPLPAAGPAAGHALAFLRAGTVAAVATRRPVSLLRSGGWADTVLELPDGRWRDVFRGTAHPGGRRPLAELLELLPVALLVRDGAGG